MIGVVALVAACSSGSKQDSAPPRSLDTQPPLGATVVSDLKLGFALALPTSWRQLPTDSASFKSAADQLRAESDKVSTGLTQLESVVRGGANVVAIDPATGATVNLIALKASEGSLDKAARLSANALFASGATDLTREATTVDGVAAIRQRFRLRFPGDHGPVDLNTTQLYVRRRGKDFVLTLSGDSPALDGIAASLKLA